MLFSFLAEYLADSGYVMEVAHNRESDIMNEYKILTRQNIGFVKIMLWTSPVHPPPY